MSAITFSVVNNNNTEEITIDTDVFNAYADDDAEGATDQLSSDEFTSLLTSEFTNLESEDVTAVVSSVFGNDDDIVGTTELNDLSFSKFSEYLDGATIDVENTTITGGDGESERGSDELIAYRAGDNNRTLAQTKEDLVATNGLDLTDEDVLTAYGLSAEDVTAIENNIGDALTSSQLSAILALKDISQLTVAELLAGSYNKADFLAIVSPDGEEPALGFNTTGTEGDGDYGRATDDVSFNIDLFLRMMGTTKETRYPLLANYDGASIGTFYDDQIKDGTDLIGSTFTYTEDAA